MKKYPDCVCFNLSSRSPHCPRAERCLSHFRLIKVISDCLYYSLLRFYSSTPSSSYFFNCLYSYCVLTDSMPTRSGHPSVGVAAIPSGWVTRRSVGAVPKYCSSGIYSIHSGLLTLTRACSTTEMVFRDHVSDTAIPPK